MRILLIEDNELLAQGILLSLAKLDMQVDHVTSIKQAEAAVINETFSAIVLDLGLPDGNGRQLLTQWRRRGIDTPTIVLTANTDFDTKLPAWISAPMTIWQNPSMCGSWWPESRRLSDGNMV